MMEISEESMGRTSPKATSLLSVVESLCKAHEGLVASQHLPHLRREYPSRMAIAEIVEDMRALLFPGFFGPSELSGETLRFHVGATLDKVLHVLEEQIKRGNCAVCGEAWSQRCVECEDKSRHTAEAFIQRLPELRRLLGTDVQAAYDGDPAATSPDEVLYCYPGMLAIASQRIAHELWNLGVPLLPRMITEHAHSVTGIDIHPGAQIGERFFIDHGTGVVIGETCVLGRNVKIYQGVTLGAKSFPLDAEGNPIKGIPRHPIVEDDVTIYAGATILGRITIGQGSVIGGNVWLTHGVPPGTTMTQAER